MSDFVSTVLEEAKIQKETQKQIFNISCPAISTNPDIVITYLVKLKHHPEKKYALLVKKAEAWLKKTLREEKMEEIEELNDCVLWWINR